MVFFEKETNKFVSYKIVSDIKETKSSSDLVRSAGALAAVLLLFAALSLIFGINKAYLYEDEVLSYTAANSLEGLRPHMENNTMYDASFVQKAVTASREHRFDYKNVMKNADFRAAFYKRFVDIAQSVYDETNAIGQLEKIAEYMRMPVVKGYSRWFGDRCSFADFDEKIEEIREFFRRRASYIVPDVKEACEM